MLLGKKILGTVAYMGGVDHLPEQFSWSWGQMIQYNTEYFCDKGEIVHYDHATVSFHSFARNCLVDRMMGDWLLMLDTDHAFEPDLCARMLWHMDQAEVDVLTGLYLYNSEPYYPKLYTKEEGGYIGGWDKDAVLFQVDSAGAGCLMVRRMVYDRIRDELEESPFDIIPPFSEDLSFFERLSTLEIKAYCAPNIESYHLQTREVGLVEYQHQDVPLSSRYEVQGF